MRFVKYCLSVFFFLFFFLEAANLVYAAEPARTVRVGVYNNKPKIYVDDNDQVAGVFADVLNYIAKKENWDLEYVFSTWDMGLTRLEKGEIDIMVDVAVSLDREKRFDFTNETVMDSWAVVYVQKGSTIKSFLDLKDKKISILKSSVYGSGEEGIDQYMKAFGIKATIVEVENSRQILDLLEIGKVDAAIVSHVFVLANQKDHPDLKATQIFLKPTELRFALTKGNIDNPYLIERLDYWVNKLKGGYEDYFHQSLKKHGLLQLELQTEPQTQQPKKGGVPYWVLPAGLGAGSVLLFEFVLMVILRKNGKKIPEILKDNDINLGSTDKKE